MTYRGTATINGATVDLRARELIRAEFDALKATYRDIDLRCGNPNCRLPVYPRLSVLGKQLFAHMPGTGEQCPDYKAEESETHLEGKHLVATAGEQAGLRAVPEYGINGRRADVALFRSDRLESHGPVLLCEVQHSPLPVVTYDSRDTDLSSALNTLDRSDRRAVIWWTTYTPSWAATRPHMQIDLDEAAVISGLYPLGNLYGDPIAAPMPTVIGGVLDGSVFPIEDRAFGTELIRQWVANPAFQATGRRKRRAPKARTRPDEDTADCTRAPEPSEAPQRPVSRIVSDGRENTPAPCETDGCKGFYMWAYIAGEYRLTRCGRCGRRAA